MSATPPRVLFLGSGYAGHRTRFQNLKRHAERERRLDARFALVSGWCDGGLIERLPVPKSVRGRLRVIAESAAIATLPPPDAIWASAGAVSAPFLWSQPGPMRRPLVIDLDWTVEQREAWSYEYQGRAPRAGIRRKLAFWQERQLWARASLFTVFSRWAAAPLLRAGIEPDRIRISPPGVDLSQWTVAARDCAGGRPLRILFVGGDLERKGGSLLANIVRRSFTGRFELDMVTEGDIECSPNVRVHRAVANSRGLRELFARADVFVMPSRADCFGIATIEAMASGVPVVVSDVGAASEIVDDGETGWLITPDAQSLTSALERVLSERDRLPSMGARARVIAEERYDGERNDGKIVDTVLEAMERCRP